MRILAGTTLLIGLGFATSCSNTTRQVGPASGGGAGEDGSGGSSSNITSGGAAGDGNSDTNTSSNSSGGAGGGAGTSAGGTSDAGGAAGTSGSGGMGDSGGTSGSGGSNAGGSAGVGGTSTTGGGTSAGGSSGTGGTGGGSSCTDVAVVDDAASGSTAPADDDFSASCGNGMSPELIFEWTAPYSDYFMFDSAGSDFDTVVTVLADCDGTELACNNTAPGARPQALAVAEVSSGETYWVAVEGNNGETGEVNLAISPVVCPSADLTGQTLPATISSVGGTTDHEARCSGQDISPQPEKTIRYVPDAAGLYRFTASSSDVRVLLSLYEGAMCGGEYLQCSFGQVGSGAYPAEVTRYLQAGEAVTVIVEGENGAGEFDVDIQLVEDNVDVCGDIPELGTGVSATIDPGSDANLLSSSCDWAGNSYGSYAEHLYRFTVNQPAGGASCYVSLEDNTGGQIATYVLMGDHCEGSEFECEATNGYHAFSRSDNGVYTLVVENRDPFQGSGTYTISNTCE